MSIQSSTTCHAVRRKAWPVASGLTAHRLFVIVALALIANATKAAQADQKVYRDDVEFLLKELPARAGHFFKAKGIHWDKVCTEFRAEVSRVTSDTEHVLLCQRLLARLRDGHAYLKDVRVKQPDPSQGRRWCGPQVHLLRSGDRVFIRQAFGQAQAQGVKVGMEVLRIEGLPAHQWLQNRVETLRDRNGYSTDHQAGYAVCHWGLADWSGTSLALELLTAAGTNAVNLTRGSGGGIAPVGPIIPPPNLKRIGRQSYGRSREGFGYIHLRDIPTELPTQLDTMLAGLGEVPGLILDLRANGGGGCDHAAVFGRFVPSGQTWRQYRSAGATPYGGPLVVIVDSGTRSAGETIAAMLKEDGRAYLIGDGPTAGMSASKTDLRVPSGLFVAHFSTRSNMRRCNGGRGIEGLGIAPHQLLAYDPVQLQSGQDTQISRATDLLRRGLPPEQVPFGH